MDPLRKTNDSRVRAFRKDMARSRRLFEERRVARLEASERLRAAARALVESRLRPWDDIPLGER